MDSDSEAEGPGHKGASNSESLLLHLVLRCKGHVFHAEYAASFSAAYSAWKIEYSLADIIPSKYVKHDSRKDKWKKF
jgi:hypothetical protein